MKYPLHYLTHYNCDEIVPAQYLTYTGSSQKDKSVFSPQWVKESENMKEGGVCVGVPKRSVRGELGWI